MLLHNSETNAQAESRSLAYGLCSVKRIENALRILYPWPRIGEKNHYISAVTKRLDGEHSAFDCFHGVDRVTNDVKEHLHQLVSIPAHSRKDGFQLQFESRI